MIQTFVSILVVPFMCLLVLVGTLVLMIRQCSHRLLVLIDWLFDIAGSLAGWDTRYWPIPKLQDETLPYREG
ncbi:MAG: hypothetical protein AMXMBFR16_11150 [Candidatus Uhrbacteria bacterium]